MKERITIPAQATIREALQVIDANVEANLFLFDTDDNLSLKMDIKNYNGTSQLFIPSLTFTFRFNNKMLF